MRLAFVVAAGIFALTACGSDAPVDEDSVGNDVGPVSVTLDDGQVVECVVFSGYKQGGIWCTPSNEEEQ